MCRNMGGGKSFGRATFSGRVGRVLVDKQVGLGEYPFSGVPVGNLTLGDGS